MFKNLSPGAVGIRGLSLAEQIELAAKTGFGGIDFSIREAADLAEENGIELQQMLEDMAARMEKLFLGEDSEET